MLEFYIGLIFLCILTVCYAVAAVGIIKEWIEDLEYELWRKRYDKK